LKKRNVVFLSIFLVIITSVLTSMFMQVNSGETGIINETSIDEFQSYGEVDELRQYILENYYLEIDNELLFEGMKKGMFDILEDPYSAYMNTEEFESYMESSSGEYPGIGIYLSPNEDNQIEIVAPIEDTPADRAGLLAKDLIIGVNGLTVDAEMMDEVVSMIKGEPGTPVTLTLYRKTGDRTFDVDIERAWIDIKVVKSRVLEDDIGYLRLSMFDEKSASEFKTHMDSLIEQGTKKVIIDLRQNPGGYLDQCVEISDMLLGRELIVYTDGRNGDSAEFNSDSNKYDVDLVVLIDGGSASASEILTAALKDNDAATIVGTTTFGKGIVQTVQPYDENTGFKLTVSQYFTPDGENIHGIGIDPDVEVVLDENYYTLEDPQDSDDNQLQKAIEIIKAK